ncbi:hypothetical protein BN424_2974 [Carnobacterium maltaromaticum LMA28]|uniref:Uncharacterized protein n=1 Tax=Carnobacterium maltaromaticum LMA28 TaxID=1234679 RepID=K8E6D8_CARML|nr:conserved hypothetical protein [Carnobacterium maltaromaticum]CCO12395.2 hypothetical protein BN424_2974 [Carnobacterium maltaromaticum LMA28]CRH22081.1 conserved hypothetical protein [Carnobacterium maltaromaticum]
MLLQQQAKPKLIRNHASICIREFGMSLGFSFLDESGGVKFDN